MHGFWKGLAMAAVGVGIGQAGAQQPPVARQVPHTIEKHGDTRTDNYYWLRERTSEEVLDYLRAENAYTAEKMAHARQLEETLFEEMKARLKEDDESVPYRYGRHLYYSRNVPGEQYRVYCRRELSADDASEEVILDVNELARGHKYFSLGALAISPDEHLLAYAFDTNGSEVYTLVVRDLADGSLRDDRLENISGSVEWAADNATLFYTTLDEARRPYKVFRHRLGTGQADDALVHHEEDERFFVGLGKTRSERFLQIGMYSKITSEVRVLAADDPTGTFETLLPRTQGVEYSIAHQGDRFLVTTNRDAINFKLLEMPLTARGWDQAREVLPHRPAIKLDGVDAFADFIAVYERKDGFRQIHVLDTAGGGGHYIAFPEPVYTASGDTNRVYDTDTLRFSYTSLVTPRSVFDYNIRTRSRELLKQEPVLGGYDPEKYESQRIEATASDGTKIPMSLVYRRGITRSGDNPTLLYGYGSYGASMDPRFSSARLSLLDRGMIFAIAHIRGGGELGRPWYEDGKFLHKMNTFTDFIACGEELVRQGYTRHDRMAMMGGSAGGLLMGAVLNMRPDLVHCAVAAVPFVDVVTTMLDPSIPLTVIEYEEWGNPNDKAFYEYMLRYSPYDNVTAQDYPHILITAGLNDPRVQYWEPAKWCARLRATKTGDNLLLMKTNMGAGHGGASGRYNRLKDRAFEYAFILDRLGISK